MQVAYEIKLKKKKKANTKFSSKNYPRNDYSMNEWMEIWMKLGEHTRLANELFCSQIVIRRRQTKNKKHKRRRPIARKQTAQRQTRGKLSSNHILEQARAKERERRELEKKVTKKKTETMREEELEIAIKVQEEETMFYARSLCAFFWMFVLLFWISLRIKIMDLN